MRMNEEEKKRLSGVKTFVDLQQFVMSISHKIEGETKTNDSSFEECEGAKHEKSKNILNEATEIFDEVTIEPSPTVNMVRSTRFVCGKFI